MSDAITQPLNQSQVAELLGVKPYQLIKARQSLSKGEDWYQEQGTNRILYTPQGLKALIKSGLGDQSLLQKLPQSAIVPSPSQPLYREPELPQWERQPVEVLEADHQIQPWQNRSQNAQLAALQQELIPVERVNYPATVNPPVGGIHGGNGGVLIINGDVNYHRSSITESRKVSAESGFSVTSKQQQWLMFAMVGLTFFALIAAMLNMFRPTVMIQQRAPYEQQVR
jgi:hypothetical protein